MGLSSDYQIDLVIDVGEPTIEVFLVHPTFEEVSVFEAPSGKVVATRIQSTVAILEPFKVKPVEIDFRVNSHMEIGGRLTKEEFDARVMGRWDGSGELDGNR